MQNSYMKVIVIAKKESVIVQGTEISVLTHRQDDYISLTDMVMMLGCFIGS